MATVTVIGRPGKITADSVIITMHAVVSEQHQLSNTITDHPVEEGFNPSDHIRPDPDIVTMDCRISNTPISNTSATEAVRAGAFTFQSSTAAADAAGAIGALDGYAFNQWKRLASLREQGVVVKVSTTLGDYNTMAIQSITAPRTAKNYDAIAFSISFKLIRIVSNKLTREVNGPANVQKKKSTGTQTATAAEENNDSPLFRGTKSGESLRSSNNPLLRAIGNFSAALQRE